MGNALRITPVLFDSLLARVRLAEKNLDDFPGYKKNIKVIDVDLHRTFTDLSMFRQGSIYHQSLRNILCAFSLFRPDMGYVQGMSYIAGTLLIHLNDEYAAFYVFANLMQEYLLFTFYSFDMPKVNILFNVFMRLVRTQIPKLFQIMQELGLQCSVFLFEWVVAVFSNILPLTLCARLWDSWLFYGEVYFMKICLAIGLCLLDKVTEGGYEMLIILFKGIDKQISEDALFSKIELIRLTTKQY